MTTALITGASSGIGLEMARLMAADKVDLVLVARSVDKLQTLADELKSHHNVAVDVIASDLSKENAAQDVVEALAGKPIDYLINNAGFGDFGAFAERDWPKLNEMIQLNMTALTQLTYLLLPTMTARGSGRILNVASTAAFQPGPWMAVYYATKAYVLSFSDALSYELRGSGVTVTTLCPGATTSGFQAQAEMENSKLIRGKKLPGSAEVAAFGYKKMLGGRGVVIHGLFNWLLAQSVRITPRAIILRFVDLVSGPAKKN
ncbi:MAG: SDR family oxidoreductase [Gammaproteobacteria bacterium]|nr:SDR family oxidoreductase [Gammaproteobacteria bacterium]